jgi:VanZ family protein
VDPLDDSSIPQYKHWKKIKNLKLHYAQWAALIATCILLIISAHLKQLQDIVWDEIEFWQWLSLGLMAVAGRLISGWCVKVVKSVYTLHKFPSLSLSLSLSLFLHTFANSLALQLN